MRGRSLRRSDATYSFKNVVADRVAGDLKVALEARRRVERAVALHHFANPSDLLQSVNVLRVVARNDHGKDVSEDQEREVGKWGKS